MYVLDNATMRAIDQATIASGTEGHVLMERAGAGAARHMLRRWRRYRPRGTTLILCGKGNNGGDGLVIARHLHRAGFDVLALLVSDNLKGEAAWALDQARRARVPMHALDRAADLKKHHEEHEGELLIDGLLGTGFRPPLEGPTQQLVEATKNLGRRIEALDCPSGLDGNTGQCDEHTPTAERTYAFGAPKWGTLLQPGRAKCGRIHVIDLEFPSDIVEAHTRNDPTVYFRREDAARVLPGRKVDAHKYTNGSVLIVGASEGMSGAVTLATQAATRAGAGLVEAIVPKGQHQAVDTNCVEALIYPAPQTDRGGLSNAARALIEQHAQKRDAILLGPGAGQDEETSELLRQLTNTIKPMVLDADALNALDETTRLTPNTILTPHDGELARLLNIPKEQIHEDRRATITHAAKQLNATLLHKGAPTFVADPTGRLAVIGAGGPGLATAGSGDVLGGTLVALLAQGLEPFDAACAAAWLHGRAGDRAESRYGTHGVSAQDLVKGIAAARKELEPR